MKLIFSIIILSGFFLFPSLSKVRESYKKAVNNKEITVQLNKKLTEISKNDDKILVAYKGAVLTLMAKFTKTTKEKKKYFKEGAMLIDYAVLENPNSIEIRCIRLGVQENTPKILKYRKNKNEDKQFIITHFKDIPATKIKAYIKGFIIQSKSFSDDEKKLFN